MYVIYYVYYILTNVCENRNRPGLDSDNATDARCTFPSPTRQVKATLAYKASRLDWSVCSTEWRRHFQFNCLLHDAITSLMR